MPFQGNPNAGQPDPALLNLLFQQKAQREERAYKMQQDALKMQAEAQVAAAENARKDELHRAKMAKLAVETMNAVKGQEEQIGAAQKTGQQVKADTAQNYPVTDYAQPVLQGGPLPAGIFPLTPQDEANVGVQKQVGQNVDDTINARYAALATNLSQFPGFEQYSNTLPMQGALAQTTAERVDQEEEQKTIRQENRGEARAIASDRRLEERQTRADYRAEAIAARSGLKEVEAENRFITAKVKAAKKAKANGNEELYTLLMDDANVVAAQRDAKLTANQPEWAGKNMDLLLKNNSSLDNYAGMIEVLDPIIANPDSIGTEATFRSVVGNAVNVFGDLGAAVMPTVEKYAQDDRIDPDVRNKMYNAIVRGVKEDGTPIAAAQLAAIRTRWLILNALDPGRVAVAQLNDMENATQFNGLLISQKLATERAKAARNELLQGLDSAQRNIRLLRPEAEFDESGRLVIGGSTPRNAAGNVFGGQSTINGPEATPPAASTGSIGDAIDAAKAALDKPLNGKKNGTAPAQPAR